MTNAEHQQCPGRGGYDAELQRHNEVLRRACGIRFRDHVLDIGCGTGQTTRQAARTARAGRALGVDVRAAAITHARELAVAEELENVAFEHADAQDYRFPHERFDLAISRFGTMFFDDPAAAFANIRRALRPTGRLVMMVWQAPARNEWDVAICQALGVPQTAAPPASGGPDPFSLADPPAVTRILKTAQFTDITFTDVREPIYFGLDVPTALAWIRNFTSTRDILDNLTPTAATRALQRLDEALTAHTTTTGVWFPSQAWIIKAHHP